MMNYLINVRVYLDYPKIMDLMRTNVSCTTINVHTLYNKADMEMIFTIIIHTFLFSLSQRKKKLKNYFHISFVVQSVYINYCA
jgi:hypothetical protein